MSLLLLAVMSCITLEVWCVSMGIHVPVENNYDMSLPTSPARTTKHEQDMHIASVNEESAYIRLTLDLEFLKNINISIKRHII